MLLQKQIDGVINRQRKECAGRDVRRTLCIIMMSCYLFFASSASTLSTTISGVMARRQR